MSYWNPLHLFKDFIIIILGLLKQGSLQFIVIISKITLTSKNLERD